MDSLKWSVVLFCLVMMTSIISPIKGVTITVTSLLESPWLMETDDNGTTIYTGFIKDMMDLLCQRANLDYNLYLVKDGMYGSKNQTGQWSGVIGEVFKGNADVAAGPVTVTASRSKDVDFSQPFQSTGPVIVMRRPEETKFAVGDRLSHILKPFESSVWLIVCMSYLMSSTIIYIISYFNPYDWRRMARDGEATIREGESFTCINTFWFAMGTLMLQGFTRAPRSVGSRIAVAFWWFFVIILLSCYIGNLSNLLRLGPKPNEAAAYSKIGSFHDLARDLDIKIAYQEGTSTEEFFSRSKNPDIQAVYRIMKSSRGVIVPNYSEGLSRVKKALPGSMAIISESLLAKYYTNVQDCSLYYVNDPIINRHFGLVFPVGSAYSKELNNALLEAKESGEIGELEARWFVGRCTNYMLEKSEDERVEIPYFYPLDLGGFSGALFILALGLVLGGLVTFVEFCIFRFAEGDEEDSKEAQNKEHGANQSLLKNDQKGMTTV